MAETTVDVQSVIIALLKNMLPKESNVTAQSRLAHDLEFDSVAMMDFTLALEERLDITIPLENIVEIETVGDLCSVVEAVVAKAY